MKATSELTVCVVDHGIFLPVARRIARDVKKVYYYSPWEEAFPSVRSSIGDGFEDVQRSSGRTKATPSGTKPKW